MDERQELAQGVSAAVERGGTRHDLSRAHRRLMIWLPLYTAIAMTAVTVVLVALPFHIHAAGNAIFAVIAALVHVGFVPGAVGLALGMRAMLNIMLRDGAERAGQERDFLDEMAIGFAILNTAFLALIFMRPLPPSNLLRSVLLGAVAVAGVLAVSYLLWLVSLSVAEDSGVTLIYLVAYALFALTLCAAVAVPLRQMVNRVRDKRLSTAVLTAAACGLVVGALTILFSYFYFANEPTNMPGAEASDFSVLVSGILFFLPIPYVLTLLLVPLTLLPLPLLLRASASYARLRRLDSEGRLEGDAPIRAGSAFIAALAALAPVLLLAAVLLNSIEPLIGVVIIYLSVPPAAAGGIMLSALRGDWRAGFGMPVLDARRAEWLLSFALLSSVSLAAVLLFVNPDVAAWRIGVGATVYFLLLISVWLCLLLLSRRGKVRLKLPGVRVLLSAAAISAGAGAVVVVLAATVAAVLSAGSFEVGDLPPAILLLGVTSSAALLPALLLHGLMRVRPIRRRAARLSGMWRPRSSPAD